RLMSAEPSSFRTWSIALPSVGITGLVGVVALRSLLALKLVTAPATVAAGWLPTLSVFVALPPLLEDPAKLNPTQVDGSVPPVAENLLAAVLPSAALSLTTVALTPATAAVSAAVLFAVTSAFGAIVASFALSAPRVVPLPPTIMLSDRTVPALILAASSSTILAESIVASAI